MVITRMFLASLGRPSLGAATVGGISLVLLGAFGGGDIYKLYDHGKEAKHAYSMLNMSSPV